MDNSPLLKRPAAGRFGGYTMYAASGAAQAIADDIILAADAGGTHALTATGIATGAPSVATPTLGQTHALTASGLTVSPAVATPTVGQVHSLTATGIGTGAPSVAAAAVGQVHVLTATGISIAPVVGSPTLGIAGGTDSLDATGISTQSPTVATPALKHFGFGGHSGKRRTSGKHSIIDTEEKWRKFLGLEDRETIEIPAVVDSAPIAQAKPSVEPKQWASLAAATVQTVEAQRAEMRRALATAAVERANVAAEQRQQAEAAALRALEAQARRDAEEEEEDELEMILLAA